MSESVTVLTDELLYGLAIAVPNVLLHTTDANSGDPTSSIKSRVHAVNRSTQRYVILERRSSLMMNMASMSDVSMTLFAPGTVPTIYGTAMLVSDALLEVPFKLVRFDHEIAYIGDAISGGACLSGASEVEKRMMIEQAADKLDGQVFAAYLEKSLVTIH
ncbi:hypothetical protein A8990_10295 [Paenibacillus taihuensis]|uniref:Uncharacterized protein n=1 Tax=Paenibacillus taihuensis TaxID=1156355 RepID=A0A3D9SQP6_9BACL|nr:hypothetical protein [Paenibacillus taihuensis]REE93011.1 hypothetical protein A8990_10295 [Paenibacillus taihuensis]